MGDCGSLALGGALAGLAILSRSELVLIILGGVYVIEVLSVIYPGDIVPNQRQKDIQNEPASPSFRTRGMERKESGDGFLDGRRALCFPGCDFVFDDDNVKLFHGGIRMEYKDQKILVVGGGRSGLAASEKLLRMGAEVFLTDMQPKEKLKGLEELGLDDTHLILEQEPDIDRIRPNLLVLSPDVPPKLPLSKKLCVEKFHSGVKLNLPSEIQLR
jgi:hypothetical protein